MTINADQKNYQIEDELLTNEQEVQELNKNESLEGPALLDSSFKSNRTENT